MRLEDRPQPDGTTGGGANGRWVFHCHIFFHAVLGMISELVVTDGDGNEKPDVNSNAVATTVNQGQTATMNGTFKSPDGNPVTLTSNVGTVTNTGNQWSWSYPTNSDSSRFVYVTATDSKGLKSQVPFFLRINNSSPHLVLPGAQRVGTGNPLSFRFSATDGDAVDPLRFGGTGLPSRLTLNGAANRTATVSGKATAAPNTYTATLSVDDTHNAPVTGQVKITIGPLGAVYGQPTRLVKGAVSTGCRVFTVSIRTCAVTAGRGMRRSSTLRKRGKKSITFKLRFTKALRNRVARSVPGVNVTLKATGKRFGSGSTLSDSVRATVVVPRLVVSPKFAAFGSGRTLTARAKTFLTTIATQVGTARQIICTGHAASGSTSLARSRGAAACAALKAAGLKARFTSTGARRPRNSRLTLTIVR